MRQKRNNKGFSLVELIVVIAIMIVLVAVLAPVFTKYVEQSRRATDVQNANSIAEAVLTDATDGTLDAALTNATNSGYTSKGGVITGVVKEGYPSSIKSAPKAKGNAVAKNASFTFEYTKDSNTVVVYVTGDTTKTNLTDESKAQAYKDDETSADNKVGAGE